MEIPNNHENQRRATRETNGPGPLQRLFRPQYNNDEGPFQEITRAIRGFFSMLFQGFKYIAITIIVLLLACVGFKFFLLILIGMQDTH